MQLEFQELKKHIVDNRIKESYEKNGQELIEIIILFYN